MLDQNTDRMWYVIGAVIVGAAIILIMNKTFPQLFASVGETFKEKTEQTTKVVDGIMPKTNVETIPLHLDDLKIYQASLVDYDDESGTLSLTINSRKENDAYWVYSRGLTVKEGRVTVPYGGRMTLSYDIYIPEGISDVYARTEVNNLLVEPIVDDWSLNDHDTVDDRLFFVNGIRYRDEQALPLRSGEWNSVSYSYVNNSAQNVNQGDIYDTTRFGVRNHLYEVMHVQLRNIEWSVSEE